MSDSFRRTAGAVLITAGIMLCCIRALTAPGGRKDRYRSADRLQWAAGGIQAERHEGGIDVNTADSDELKSLYGIGDTLAALIVEERVKNGPFHYAEDLESVKGIGPRTLEKMRDRIDLNPDESGE